MVSLKKIVELRLENDNMSQRQLADSLGVTQASISRWEQNQMSISGENLAKLAIFFNVTADELLGIADQTQAK